MHSEPHLENGRLVLAFTGWMDGGDVSTGTVKWLAKSLDAQPVADIDPESFYICNFPGSTEVSALFRPKTKIVDGVIEELTPATNTFFCDQGTQLVLFDGKEPNLNWGRFADRVFSFAERVGVAVIYFVGSYAGMVPHTREPRLTSTVSDAGLKPELARYGVDFTNYEGPASFATSLLTQASQRGFRMASVVAEIPSYIEGKNPRCIEAVVRKLAAILGLQVNVDKLRKAADDWEHRLTETLEDNPEVAELVGKLEEHYDDEVFDTQMGDLKTWLKQRGLRVD